MNVHNSNTPKTGGDYVTWMKNLEARYRKASVSKTAHATSSFIAQSDPPRFWCWGTTQAAIQTTFIPMASGSGAIRRNAARRRPVTSSTMSTACWIATGPRIRPSSRSAPFSARARRSEKRSSKQIWPFDGPPGIDSFETVQGMTLNQAYKEAQPFIREIVERVQPRLVLLEGSLLEKFKKRLGISGGQLADEPVKTMHRGSQIDLYRAECVTIPGVGGTVLGCPIGTPSYHGLKYGKEGIGDRIKNLLGGPL